MIPTVYSNIYAPKVESTRDKEFEKIKSAFETLGIKEFNKDEKAECRIEYVSKFNLYMPCSSTVINGSTIMTSADLMTFRQRAKSADSIFEKNGWHPGVDGNLAYTTVTWPNGRYGATSSRLINSVLCYFDLDTHPQTDATRLYMDMRCQYGKSRP